jgi:hypothetical protein
MHRINWTFVVAVLSVLTTGIATFYGIVAAAVYVISRTDITTVMLTR